MILRMKARLGALVLLVIASAPLCAQGRRDYTRPTHERDEATIEQRESEITLTVAPVAEQLIQTWIRTAGLIDPKRNTLTACVGGEDSALIRPGQRVRAFSPDSKSSIYQARVRSATAGEDCVTVEAALSGPTYRDATRYVMEIIVDRGQMLAVANAAIIERGGKEIVYEQIHPGHYEPHEIRTGLKGETYTEVLDGLAAGMPVVTIGSFFIDAEYRLKATPGNAANAHQHH